MEMDGAIHRSLLDDARRMGAEGREPSPISSVAAARIAAPRPAANVIRRDRLFDLLEAGVEGSLTVVTGPPGAGKTVLLSTWLAGREPSGTVAWVSVERSDSRPGGFWTAVLDAVRAAGETRIRSIAVHVPRPADEFVPAFANTVAALPASLILILDDFHELHAPAVSEELDTLLRHPPGKLHLVIASRADPELSLHRLRLEGQLTELRSRDLAFTTQEASELFALAGLELTADQVSALHERTEGWVAGLRLAALSLRASADPDELVRTFAGDERSVADYLVEEVLHRAPRPMREFMLQTSVVDLVSPDLADALTRGRDGAWLLEELERSNAFVSALDNHRDWYRYHPMFRELLRSQLRHRMPDVFARQHRRAALWYAARSRGAAATRHALAASDWELAANLLSDDWLNLLVRGEATQLADLAAHLPRGLISRDPELAIATAGALFESGELEQGQDYMRLADDNSSAVKPKRRSNLALSRTIASLYEARLLGELDAVSEAARRLLAGHGSGARAIDGPDRRALALLHRGVAETWIGRPRSARAALESSLALARGAGRGYLVLCAVGALALLEAVTGSLRRSARLAEDGIRVAEHHGWVRLAPCATARIALVVCTYHWGSVADANRHLEWADLSRRASEEPTMLAITEIMRALVAARSGDPERAELTLLALKQDTIGWKMPSKLAVALARAEGEMLLAAGRDRDALDTIERARPLGHWAELELVAARLALADGDPAATAELVSRAMDGMATLHPSTAIELRALGAVAKHQRADADGALELVEQALALAQPEGYVEPFLAVGVPLRELLVRRIRARTAYRGLVGTILDALEVHAVGSVGERSEPLLEPLSEREAAVLRYLPTAQSKAEIASEMFVSVNTVKTHMKNIYRKLDVTSRSEAVRRARSLQLV